MTENNIVYLLLSLIVSYFIVFGVGLFLGHYYANTGVSKDSHIGFLRTISQQNIKDTAKSLSIDDRKVVLGLDTEGLQKKYSQLGDTQKQKEDISSSINKLKNMKG
jgi:hypothetical protein